MSGGVWDEPPNPIYKEDGSIDFETMKLMWWLPIIGWDKDTIIPIPLHVNCRHELILPRISRAGKVGNI